jgi:hypothetical protein
MRTENLNTQELETLRTLLNKMAAEPTPFDPIGVMIDEIMEEFDFHKVFRTMDALDWKWRTVSDGKGTPSIDDLRETAEYLLRGVSKSRLDDFKDSHWELGIINATGGFQATAYCDEDKTKITALSLQFVVTEWNVDIEDLTK